MALRGLRIRVPSFISVSSPTDAELQETLVDVAMSHEIVSRLARTVRVIFQWSFIQGGIPTEPAPVTGFGVNDIQVPNGVILHQLRKISDSKYHGLFEYTQNVDRFTIVVNANSVSLITDPQVTAPETDKSYTVNLNIALLGVPTVNMSMQTILPGSPNVIYFDWVYTDGTPAYVEGFVEGDVTVPSGYTLSSLTSDGNDLSRWSGTLSIPSAATGSFDVTVGINAVDVVNTDPSISGPASAVTETFTIPSDVAGSTITGNPTICELERDIVSNEFLNSVVMHLGDNAGGAFVSVLESAVIDDYSYFVVEIQKHLQTVDEDGMLTNNPLLQTSQAGAVLMRVDHSTCTYEAIKAYSDVAIAARSLAVDGDILYFFEGSHYAYDDRAIFSDENWKQKVGHLRKIDHTTGSIVVEDLGISKRSATTTDAPDADEPDFFYGVHGGTASPILVDDGIVNLLTGFGNFDDLQAAIQENRSKHIDNWNWITYEKSIRMDIPVLLTNDRTRYDVLKDLAVVTDSIIGFNNNGMYIQPREYRKAKLHADMTDSQTSMTLKDFNWDTYPTTGNIKIDDEIVSYENQSVKSSGIVVTRASRRTTAVAHTADTEVFFVDHIISLNNQTQENPVNEISINNDYHQFYNLIKINGRKVASDETSISDYGEREIDIQVPLDDSQKDWKEYIGGVLLDRFKQVRQIINLTLKFSPYLQIGDTMMIYIENRIHLSHTCQVLEIQHTLNTKETKVKLVII